MFVFFTSIVRELHAPFSHLNYTKEREKEYRVAKTTNWKVLREQLPHRYTKAISKKIEAFIGANADAAKEMGYEAMTSRQVELVFKGKIKDSLKVACVLRFAMIVSAQHAPVRKMLSSPKRKKTMKAGKV
jgi:DNA-binding transcriptional regulator GbsR (MarR family)